MATKKKKPIKYHTFQIGPVDNGSSIPFSHGTNTQIMMDGKPIKGVTRVTLTLSANTEARLLIEVIGHIEFIGKLAGMTVVKGEL